MVMVIICHFITATFHLTNNDNGEYVGNDVLIIFVDVDDASDEWRPRLEKRDKENILATKSLSSLATPSVTSL